MKILLITLRLPILIIHTLLGLFILIFFPKNKLHLKKTHYSINVIWMKILILIFGLKIKLRGKKNNDASVFVSNHVSFLDIIALNSELPVSFIAKSEIESWPIIGHLASKTGTIFIKRGEKQSSDKIMPHIKNHLASGNKILFFPEGRIGDGISVKKFHSKLFYSVSKLEIKIQPISIRYPKKYPQDLNSDNNLTWSDDSQTLLNIGFKCLGKPSTIVLLNFGKPLDASNLEPSEIAKLTADSVAKSLSSLS